MSTSATAQTSQAELLELAEAFELFDTAGNGTIPLKQIDCVLKTVGIVIPEATMLAMQQNKADEGETEVSYAELVQLLTSAGETEEAHEESQRKERAARFRRALALFDTNGTGLIPVVELRKALRDVLKESEIDALVKKADAATSGKVSYDKLVSAMFGTVA